MPVTRLRNVIKEFNISLNRAVEFLSLKGINIEHDPNSKIESHVYDMLEQEFQKDKVIREEVEKKIIHTYNEKQKPILEKNKKKEEDNNQKIESESEIKDTFQVKESLIKEIDEIQISEIISEVIIDNENIIQNITNTEKENNSLKIIGKIELPDNNKKIKLIKKDNQIQNNPEKNIVTDNNIIENKNSNDTNIDLKTENISNTDENIQTNNILQNSDLNQNIVTTTKEEINTDFQNENIMNSSNNNSEQKETNIEPEKIIIENQNISIENNIVQESNLVIETQYKKLDGPKITGQKIDLSQFEKPKILSKDKKELKKDNKKDKKKRKRIKEIKVDVDKTVTITKGNSQSTENNNQSTENKPKLSLKKNTNPKGANNFSNNRGPKRPNFKERVITTELSEEEVQNKIKETYEKLTNKNNKSKSSKYRKDKRILRRENEALKEELEEGNNTLNVTEFITVNELASIMDVSPTEVISACFSLGVMVTMNQRLEADTLTLVADEFGYKANFVDAEIEEAIAEEEEENPDDLLTRAPIVTVMGHVDHGKTSLLDHIRSTNVIAGESGGITQHIGAYNVILKSGQKITFLDTPGHEAFTAMRARGAQVTDIAIIVIAADDDVMPQTKEAISHAQAAGVPMIIAFNKVDKPTANTDKIREQLSAMNILVEEWGGKYQSQEISAKFGTNVDVLLDKVLLEAEVLDLKANPNKGASGVVIEASLDKGRGYVSTILVQSGTLKVGDYILAGKNHGKVRALLDERGHNIKEAKPSTPATILGLDGAPTAGDKFKVFQDEREAKQLANKREQLQREQSLRSHKHITLNEIGRRIALGDFKELNIILKGDVDGSVEALTDSLQKLSTEEIHINILHKGVGQITESDILLASASNAIVIGFNVRPSNNAKDLADKEEIEIRYYSIIYSAIEEIKEAMEGMLSPEIKEQIIGNVEIRETFKITKVGTIAGCMVTSGKVTRNSKIRLLREGIVIHDGVLESLKRFKDDAKEVTKNYECGLNIKGFNNIQIGDVLEVYEEIEVKKKLK